MCHPAADEKVVPMDEEVADIIGQLNKLIMLHPDDDPEAEGELVQARNHLERFHGISKAPWTEARLSSRLHRW